MAPRISIVKAPRGPDSRTMQSPRILPGCLWALLMLLLAACRSLEEEPAPAVQNPEEPSPFDPDEWHRKLSSGAKLTGAAIDEYLSDDRSVAEENNSWFQVELRTFWEEREGQDLGLKVRGSLALPNSKKRAQLVLSGEDEESVGFLEEPDASFVDETNLDTTDESGLTLALKYFLRESKRNNVSISGGLSFNGVQPDPYGSLRWRHEERLDWATIRGTERFRYFLGEGGESRTVLDLERTLSESFFARLTGTGDWYEAQSGFEYAVFARLYQRVRARQLLTYEVGSGFRTEPQNVMSSIFARVRARQLFTRDWILVELAPQIAWRRDLDYEPSLGIFISFQFTFREEGLVGDPLGY